MVSVCHRDRAEVTCDQPPFKPSKPPNKPVNTQTGQLVRQPVKRSASQTTTSTRTYSAETWLALLIQTQNQREESPSNIQSAISGLGLSQKSVSGRYEYVGGGGGRKPRVSPNDAPRQVCPPRAGPLLLIVSSARFICRGVLPDQGTKRRRNVWKGLTGQLDAVAIVANVGTPKKWRSAFRRCGIRLGDGTNAVDGRAGTDGKIPGEYR